MGEMSSHVRDTIAVVEDPQSKRRHLYEAPLVGYTLITSGSVIFDHLSGLRAVKSAPKGFALVEFWYDFDWTQQHGVRVTPFDDVNALVEKANALVAEARAAGVSGNMDLTEVYGIIVD